MNIFNRIINPKNSLTIYLNKTIFIFIFLSVGFSSLAQQPAGFQDNVYASGFDGVNGITFDAFGRAYVWEKGGKVKCRTLDGIWHVVLDIGEEINIAIDSGLKGFALHPDFLTNGFIYLMYDVDRYHLINYGTAEYDPTKDDHLNASIGRITRYTIDLSNFTSIVPNTRLIILGTSPTDGIPVVSDAHNVGSLVFGTDGTLIASIGESAKYNNEDAGSAPDTYYQQALLDGILKSDDPNTPMINENENVGSWRAQMINSLSGKILRIDPLTGAGIPSNPFYDSANPKAAKSRVWAMGFRNPFRMTIKPNTGEHFPSAGDPGVIYLGDVGSNRREEINVITTGGQNFGWPQFEGMNEADLAYPIVVVPFERNEFTIPFAHTRPVVDFRGLPARAHVHDEIREISRTAINAIPGDEFVGGCSIGGVFYQGTNFPAEYQGRYLHGNFNNGEEPEKNWIQSFKMNADDELTESHSFLTNTLGVTGMAVNPVNGYLYYVSYGGSIREVKYDTGNQPPIAKATQDIKYGTSPLTVKFNGSQSSDPENRTLTYAWNFGDGSAISSDVSPNHLFTTPNSNPTRFDVTLTVTDDQNQTNSTSLIISVNNTPPIIQSTSVDTYDVYPNAENETINLQAIVSDNETPSAQLAFKWETSLHHDTHFHPNPVVNQASSGLNMSPLPCDNEVYFYQVQLTVTDPHGLSTTNIKNIVPDCRQPYVDREIPSRPTNLQLNNVNASRISFSWTPSTDNVAVATYEIFKDGVKIDESINPTYAATGLLPSTFYLFSVTAKDAAGNISSKSDSLGVYTNAIITTDEIIYGDALGSNWQNFSSISALNISNSTPKFINTRSIKVTNPTMNQALDLRYNGFPLPIDTTGYSDGFEFWVYNDGDTPFPLNVQLFSTNSGTVAGNNLTVDAEPHKWKHILLDRALLGDTLTLTHVGKISIKLGQTQTESLYFDEIKLVHCADMHSIASGNWNQSSTWSCGRIPISTDYITISGGNVVTVPTGVSATLNFLQLIGTLNVQTGGTFDINNY